jgi:hypothetical protein
MTDPFLVARYVKEAFACKLEQLSIEHGVNDNYNNNSTIGVENET